MVDLSLIADISRGFLAPAFVFALLALALNVQWGHTGLLNAGVAGFFAIGAYVGAIFATRPEAPRTGVPGHAGLANLFPTSIPLELIMGLWIATLGLVVIGIAVRRTPRKALGHRLIVLGAAGSGIAITVTVLRLIGVSTSLLAGSLVAMFVAGLVGLLIAIPALRLRADYLAIGTLALGAIVVESIRNFEAVTGGVYGISGIVRPWEFGAETFKTEGLFALATGLLVLITFLMINRATRSPWGRVLRAVREDEDAALALGKNTYFFKLQAFVFGAALMGLAGVVFAVLLRAIFPDPFVPALTFSILVMVVVGGSGSNTGVVVGALGLSFLEYFTVRAKDWFEDPGSVPLELLVGVWTAAVLMVAFGLILRWRSRRPRLRRRVVVAGAAGAFIGLTLMGLNVYGIPREIEDRIFHVRLIVIGVLLIVLVLVRPKGLLPEPRKVTRRPWFVLRRA